MTKLLSWAIVAGLLASTSLTAGLWGAGGAITPGFSGVTYGQFAVYGNGACPAAKCITGDGFYNTWADDGNIYTVTGDTASGWNGATSGGRNTMVSTLSGWTTAMTGTLVGDMAAWGTQGQAGSDSADYKSSGLISIGSTLYMWVYRHSQVGPRASNSAHLLISANHGSTWSPTPPSTAQPYASPMFTDARFSFPAFVQYPYKGYSGQTVDRSNQFVYAYSADASLGGFGGQADTVYLARVPVSTIGNQSAADWQFYQGGDGMLDSSWGALATTTPIINEPGCKCHVSPQTFIYLPYWRKYIYIDYSWPSITSATWGVYQLDHPWGPWVRRQSDTWNSPGTAQTLNAYGMYLPGIIMQSAVADGGRSFVLLTTGDYNVGSMYTMYIVPVTVNP